MCSTSEKGTACCTSQGFTTACSLTCKMGQLSHFATAWPSCPEHTLTQAEVEGPPLHLGLPPALSTPKKHWVSAPPGCAGALSGEPLLKICTPQVPAGQESSVVAPRHGEPWLLEDRASKDHQRAPSAWRPVLVGQNKRGCPAWLPLGPLLPWEVILFP